MTYSPFYTPPPPSSHTHTMTSHCATKRYASLKADVSVSLEGSGTQSGGTMGQGTGGLGGDGGPKTIADMLTSGQMNAGGIVDAGSSSPAEGGALFGQGQAQQTAFLWGCTSEQEERDQLLSFVCLGCFDPAARLQVGDITRDCVRFVGGRLATSQQSRRTLIDARLLPYQESRAYLVVQHPFTTCRLLYSCLHGDIRFYKTQAWYASVTQAVSAINQGLIVVAGTREYSHGTCQVLMLRLPVCGCAMYSTE